MRSVAIRSPEGSVVSWWLSGLLRAAVGVAVGAAAAVAPVTVAPTATAAAVAAAVAVAAAALTARPTVAAAARATVAGADADELLGRLARDLRVVGEAQADAAALPVDLDDADLEVLALLEDLLDRL